MHVTPTNGSEPLEDAIRNITISLGPSNAVRMVLSYSYFYIKVFQHRMRCHFYAN